MPHIRYVIGWYLLLSLITIGAYGLDKWKAARAGRGYDNGRSRGGRRGGRTGGGGGGGRGGWGGQRIPERTLHGLELLGGWPGALVGQQLFKHKRSKAPYMRVFWVIVLLHLAAWTWWVVR